jgi:hypothetical protein
MARPLSLRIMRRLWLAEMVAGLLSATMKRLRPTKTEYLRRVVKTALLLF